jgi:hypothetical protein
MNQLNMVFLADQEMREVKVGACFEIGVDRSCGCACVNDGYDENGDWDYTHTTENHAANWDSHGADGWGAWSPSLWHLRKPPRNLSDPLL